MLYYYTKDKLKKAKLIMTKFYIENARIETITDFDVVTFDLVTDKGTVELSEHINYDNDGDFESIETADSNICINMESELCSVFDMSDKPSLMPSIDYVPFHEVIEAVEKSLQLDWDWLSTEMSVLMKKQAFSFLDSR